MAIGNVGSVVGCAGKRAALYQSAGFFLLPLPQGNTDPGAPEACALGINANGEIVGFKGDNAFIYTQTH